MPWGGGRKYMRSIRFSIAWLMTVVLVSWRSDWRHCGTPPSCGLELRRSRLKRCSAWRSSARFAAPAASESGGSDSPHSGGATRSWGVLYPWMRTPMQRMLEAHRAVLGRPDQRRQLWELGCSGAIVFADRAQLVGVDLRDSRRFLAGPSSAQRPRERPRPFRVRRHPPRSREGRGFSRP